MRNRWPGWAMQRKGGTLAPPDLSGLQFWYRGDSAVPSAGNLTGWTDKTANGRNLNLISASPPTVVPAVINGKTVVHFSSASSQDARRNQPAPIVGTGGYTVFIIKRTLPTLVQRSHFAVDSGTGPNGCISIGVESPDGKYEVRYVPIFAAAAPGFIDNSNAFLIQRVRQAAGTPVTMHINGVRFINGPATAPSPAGLPQICVGSAGAFAEFCDGDIAEVALFTPELSINDCERLEQEYFTPYYGIGAFSPAEIADMVANNALAALWDTGVPSSVVLNGALALSVQDLTGHGFHVSQAVGANQPQYTSAPIYGTWPSLMFTAGLATRLSRLNTSLITTPNVGTLIWVGALTGAGGQFQFSNLNDPAGSEGIDIGSATGSNRIVQSPRAGGLALGHSSTTNNPIVNVPDVFMWVVDGISSTFYVNGIVTANTNGSNPQLIPTTPTDALTIGAIIPSGAGAESFNWLFGAWFNSALSPALVATITNRLKGRLGLP